MTTYTPEYIKEMLNTNDKWLCRGIIAIYNKQTADEKEAETTKHSNGVGFSGCDAEILSSFAKQLLAGRSLSNKQREISRKKIVKYAKQLATIANGGA